MRPMGPMGPANVAFYERKRVMKCACPWSSSGEASMAPMAPMAPLIVLLYMHQMNELG